MHTFFLGLFAGSGCTIGSSRSSAALLTGFLVIAALLDGAFLKSVSSSSLETTT